MSDPEISHSPGVERKKLVVVFDTNSIYTESGFHIISDDAKRLIRDTRERASLQVTWVIPSVVLQERIYRLRQKVASLLDRVSSVSELTGGDLDITEAGLLEALDRKVQQTLKDYGLEVPDRTGRESI